MGKVQNKTQNEIQAYISLLSPKEQKDLLAKLKRFQMLKRAAELDSVGKNAPKISFEEILGEISDYRNERKKGSA